MPMFPAKVLVAVGSGDSTDHALRAAVDLAADTGSPLSLAHVKLLTHTVAGVPPGPARHDQLEAEGQALLRRSAQRVEDLGGKVVSTHLRLGRRVETELARLATQLAVDLVVVGGDLHTGMATVAALGSVTQGVVRQAPCSVLVARPIP